MNGLEKKLIPIMCIKQTNISCAFNKINSKAKIIVSDLKCSWLINNKFTHDT